MSGDAVYDAPRILRLPMTLNHKYTPPRMVEIIHATGRQLSIAELETNFRVNDRLESNLPTPISPQSPQDYPIATALAGVPEGKRDNEIFKLAQSLNRANCPCMHSATSRSLWAREPGCVSSFVHRQEWYNYHAMSRLDAVPSSSLRTRLPFLIVALFVLGIVVVVATRLLGLWGDKIANPGNPNSISVTYTTEADDGSTPASARGVVNSPLKVIVRVPWSTGSQDTVLSSVSLQLLDEAGQPAKFGNAPATEVFAMKPTFDIAEWVWQGSIPGAPGKFHARVQIEALYNKERNAQVDLTNPTVEAIAESGTPLTSGFVLASNANIWLMSTDTTRQRRLTFFPEFYEYADKPAWSPDGKRIAFTYSPRTDPSQLPATDIWQVGPDGSDPKPLVTHQEGESLLDPAWSADGKYLYFTSDTSASTVFTDTTGMPGGALGTGVQIDRIELATGIREQWMPDSQMASGDATGGDTIYLQYVPLQGSGEGMVAPPQRLMKADESGETTTVLADETQYQLMYAPRMSPDGKWVVFAAINIPPVRATPANTPTPGGGITNYELRITNYATSRTLRAREVVPIVLSSVLSPQSSVLNEAHGLPWDIYIVPSTGGGKPIRLTKLDEDQPYPVWLDNETIAFMGTQGLFRISIDQSGNPVGEPEKIHDGAPHGGLSWRGP